MSERAGEDARGLAALGAAIEASRAQAGLSTDQLAAGAEMTKQSLEAMEAGQEEPTWGDLRRLAHALGTSLEKLLETAERLEQGEQGDSASKL
jgi:transcriptional regulator with XRE-family HTH domain